MKIESVYVALAAILAAVAPFVFPEAVAILRAVSWVLAVVSGVFAVALWRFKD